MNYQRIQIVGSSGSGKTTLGRKLSEKLKIPHYELDSLFWLPEWQEKPQKEFERDVQKIVNKDSWILCGDYIKRLNGMSLNRAEVVIWLNYPLRISLARMIKRSTKRVFSRELLWGVNKENYFNFWFRPSKSLLWITIGLYREQGRRRQEEKMEHFGYSGPVIEFNHPRELESWLKNL